MCITSGSSSRRAARRGTPPSCRLLMATRAAPRGPWGTTWSTAHAEQALAQQVGLIHIASHSVKTKRHMQTHHLARCSDVQWRTLSQATCYIDVPQDIRCSWGTCMLLYVHVLLLTGLHVATCCRAKRSQCRQRLAVRSWPTTTCSYAGGARPSC